MSQNHGNVGNERIVTSWRFLFFFRQCFYTLLYQSHNLSVKFVFRLRVPWIWTSLNFYPGMKSKNILTLCSNKRELHSLPNDKILDWSKFKACADDKINLNENLKFVLWKVNKTLWEKEKMPVTSIFSFSHNVFIRLFLFGGRHKSGLCGKEWINLMIHKQKQVVK